jgi:hypothetical protein
MCSIYDGIWTIPSKSHAVLASRTQSKEHDSQPSFGTCVNCVVTVQNRPVWRVIWWRFLEPDVVKEGVNYLTFRMKWSLIFKQKLVDDVIKSCRRSSDDILPPLPIPLSSDSFHPCRTTFFRNQIMDSYWHISSFPFKVNFDVRMRALGLLSNVTTCLLTYNTNISDFKENKYTQRSWGLTFSHS